MTCWHCDNELQFNSPAVDSMKVYHCPKCDKWYEMRKDKERVNGAVPVRMVELDSYPQVYAAA
jgi:hypothetical protein